MTTLRRTRPACAVVADLPHGWIVKRTLADRTGFFAVGVDAVERPLPVGTKTEPAPGDVALRSADGRLLIYRPSTGTLHPVPRPPVRHPVGGYVTGSGALVVVGGAKGSAAWARYDGRRWRHGTFAGAQTADAVSGAGNTVVVVLGGSQVGDARAVAGVAVSRDGGATWASRPAPHGVLEALSDVVTRDGIAFISTGSGQLLRARRGHGVEVVPGVNPVSLSTAGNQLYAMSTERTLTRWRLRLSTDGGRTWRRVPPPGARAE